MPESSIALLGYIAATCTTMSFLPQVIQIVKTRRTKDLSLGMYIVLFTGSLLWMWYGFLLQLAPIYIPNILVAMLAAIILVMKVKHG